MLTRRLIAVGILVCASTAAAQDTGTPEATSRPDGEGTSAPSLLSQDRGWDSQWALLFSLNNVLVVGNILGDFNSPIGGAIAASRHLAPDLAVRLAVRANRATVTPVITEQVIQIGEERIVTRTHNRPSVTSLGRLGVSADLLKRFSSHAVAPYAGGGVFTSWVHSEANWRDDVSNPDLTTSADDSSDTVTFGAQGALGAEWRLHPNFALFAEYGLQLNVYSRIGQEEVRTDESPADQSRATVTTRSTREEWLNFSTGLFWGGQFGLVVHFQ